MSKFYLSFLFAYLIAIFYHQSIMGMNPFEMNSDAYSNAKEVPISQLLSNQIECLSKSPNKNCPISNMHYRCALIYIDSIFNNNAFDNQFEEQLKEFKNVNPEHILNDLLPHIDKKSQPEYLELCHKLGQINPNFIVITEEMTQKRIKLENKIEQLKLNNLICLLMCLDISDQINSLWPRKIDEEHKTIILNKLNQKTNILKNSSDISLEEIEESKKIIKHTNDKNQKEKLSKYLDDIITNKINQLTNEIKNLLNHDQLIKDIRQKLFFEIMNLSQYDPLFQNKLKQLIEKIINATKKDLFIYSE